jgi:ATP-dependent DNA ligase
VYVDHIDRACNYFYRAACEQDLEGIVAKRKDGLYTPEEKSWAKVQNSAYSQMGRAARAVREASAGSFGMTATTRQAANVAL